MAYCKISNANCSYFLQFFFILEFLNCGDNNLKELPNTKLIEVMDKLTVTFDLTKENVISLTIYLDKLEELYNNTLKEYQSRKL